MINRLIRCIQCNQVFPISSFFDDPKEISLLLGIEWSDEDLAYRKEFDRSHRNHLHEELWVEPEPFFSEKPSYEPARVTYFEATNGQQRFLIKRSKAGLPHPAYYEIISGQMQVSSIDIDIQDADLRAQISADPVLSILPKGKVEKFIAVFRGEVEGILSHHFSEAVENFLEGDVPLFTYASLKNNHWKKILAKCAQAFNPSELTRIGEFIQENQEPGEVLSLLIRRKMSILPEEGPNSPSL
jgi:hypothetical protein